MIKIDTEGSEEAVWSGMDRTIRQNPGIIIVMEFKRDSYVEPRLLLDRIHSYRFPLRHVDDSGALQPLSVETLSGDRGGEWALFLQR